MMPNMNMPLVRCHKMAGLTLVRRCPMRIRPKQIRACKGSLSRKATVQADTNTISLVMGFSLLTAVEPSESAGKVIMFAPPFKLSYSLVRRSVYLNLSITHEKDPVATPGHDIGIMAYDQNSNTL
jgi:hypothetical protein